MSYEIIYDKQFIRMPKGFIAMTLAGSNNCYQAGSGNKMKRSRDWCNWNSINKLVCTEQELLDYVNATRERLIKQYDNDDEHYNDKRFGYFLGLGIGGAGTHTTTFGNFKGVFSVGIQKALTVEELKEHGISTRIFTSSYSEEENRKNGFEPINFCPKTSQELQDFIDENEIKPIRFYFDFYGASEHTFKNMRLRTRVSKPKDKKLVTTAYAIVIHTGAYFWKFTKYGYKYSYSSPKYYYSESLAKAALKKVKERIGDNAKIETISLHTPVLI
jgi:hypothetical protein